MAHRWRYEGVVWRDFLGEPTGLLRLVFRAEKLSRGNMLNWLNLFGNQEINAWRDNHTLLAAAILNQVAVDLI
jgi:hypothetical protein